ncbi:MAG: ATP-binding protein [Candidatus Bathyarchaeia archaeon]
MVEDMDAFNPERFVESQVKEIRRSVGGERALVAVSGGVDSATCAVLARRALGENLVCVILDDAFMREDEPRRVAETLSKPPLSVPVEVVDVRERFLEAMEGLRDAEEKRRMFRETFYQALAETARKRSCTVLIQGTIKADVVETVGGVKTQHNVLEQMGINPMERYGFRVIEPLLALYKGQVRMVARYLGLPAEISERQPFPGPGLSVRVVGEIRLDKLETLRKATSIVENGLAEHSPSQYFAVILDNEEVEAPEAPHIRDVAARLLDVPSGCVDVKFFRDKATGVIEGKRRYGEVVGVTVRTMKGLVYQKGVRDMVSLQEKIISENPGIVRVFYAIQDSGMEKPYVIGVRAVQTRDFLTAQVSEIPWSTLNRVAGEVIGMCPNVAAVYYDATPKPPATIEME